MRRRAISWRGIRTATVGRPAVTMSGTSSLLGRTTVRGPGQNRSDQLLCRAGDIRDQPSQVIRARDMNDQRIKMRSLLDFEDPGDGKRGKGVGSQAIHGLRWKGNDPSPLDDLCGMVNSSGSHSSVVALFQGP